MLGNLRRLLASALALAALSCATTAAVRVADAPPSPDSGDRSGAADLPLYVGYAPTAGIESPIRDSSPADEWG
jgi:hypothetical protein